MIANQTGDMSRSDTETRQRTNSPEKAKPVIDSHLYKKEAKQQVLIYTTAQTCRMVT